VPSSSPEVIELLEAYLASAKKNAFDHVAIVMTGHPNVAAIDYAGEIVLEELAYEGVKSLKKKLETSISNWRLPPADASLDQSYVRYNLANGPLGYDFLVWLVDAEMARIRAGAPAPLKVGFWLGHDAIDRMGKDGRRNWLEKVFRPALTLIGAVEDPRAIHGHHNPVFVSRGIVAAAKKGEAVPKFNASSPISAEGAVTITLRESEHWKHRNSNLEAWVKFAKMLRDKGQEVIFVRDTAKATIKLGSFKICPEASVDLNARMALYQTAKANLFVSNGPATLALFSDKPWLQFVSIESESSNYAQNTRKFWKESMGVEPYREQYPWSNPTQRIVWTTDSYDNVVSAWDALKLS
jgi:hypothetical protein